MNTPVFISTLQATYLIIGCWKSSFNLCLSRRFFMAQTFPGWTPVPIFRRVLLADIEDSVKGKILRGNAIRVYRLGVS